MSKAAGGHYQRLDGTLHSPTHHGEGGGGLLQEPHQARLGEVLPRADALLVGGDHVVRHCRLLQHVGRHVLEGSNSRERKLAKKTWQKRDMWISKVKLPCFWSCLLEIAFRKKILAYRYSPLFQSLQNVLFLVSVALNANELLPIDQWAVRVNDSMEEKWLLLFTYSRSSIYIIWYHI